MKQYPKVPMCYACIGGYRLIQADVLWKGMQPQKEPDAQTDE